MEFWVAGFRRRCRACRWKHEMREFFGRVSSIKLRGAALITRQNKRAPNCRLLASRIVDLHLARVESRRSLRSRVTYQRYAATAAADPQLRAQLGTLGLEPVRRVFMQLQAHGRVCVCVCVSCFSSLCHCLERCRRCQVHSATSPNHACGCLSVMFSSGSTFTAVYSGVCASFEAASGRRKNKYSKKKKTGPTPSPHLF